MRMKLGNLLLVWFLAIIFVAGLGLAGWGVAFAFAYNVFIPWLEVVPVEYYKLAAFVAAFVFDGLGVLVVAGTLAALGFGAAAIWRLLRRS